MMFVTGWQFGIIAAAAFLNQGVAMLPNGSGLFHFNIPVFVCVTVAIGASTSKRRDHQRT